MTVLEYLEIMRLVLVGWVTKWDSLIKYIINERDLQRQVGRGMVIDKNVSIWLENHFCYVVEYKFHYWKFILFGEKKMIA